MQIDMDALVRVAQKLVERADPALTRAERAEVLRIAQGVACKDSATASNVSAETIRSRRKHIYRKLGIPATGEIQSALLALSLEMIATRPSESASANGGVVDPAAGTTP
jgi:DNA-binding CsgD family transcriptional regulator